MSQQPLAPPPPFGDSGKDRWLWLLWQRMAASGQVKWAQLDFTSSALTDILTRNHVDLQNLQGGTTAEYYHLTSAEYTGTGAGVFARKTSPAFETPSLGVATATSLNKVTLTAPATAATLTLDNNTTLTGPAASGTIVLQNNVATLTNKALSGSSNTLSDIANASLTNSSITIAGHAVSLGGTQTLAAADLTDTVVGTGAIVLKSYADGLGSFPVELQAYAAAQG